jgi:5S rRNA maturation endonuclease (ribonuclease M5)
VLEKSFTKLYSELGVNIVGEHGDNAQAYCKAHNDKEKPSLSININNGLYKCFVASCPAFKGGNYRQYYKIVTGKDLEDTRVIPDSEVVKFHETLLKNSAVLKWLHDLRGINDETIARFRLGWDGERVTIPIFDVNRQCVNIRRHSPVKGAKNKVISYNSGFGSIKIFPISALEFPRIIICEGELDAIVACQLGFNACTVTGGAGSWKTDLTPLFKGKEVILVYDIDPAGRHGANIIAHKLTPVASLVKDLLLPITKPSNADVTDYVVTYGNGAAEFEALIEACPVFKAGEPAKFRDDRAPIEVNLNELSKPELIGRKVAFKGVVAGRDLSPYAAPCDITFTCRMGLKVCGLCSIGNNNGTLKYRVDSSNLEILRLIDVTEEQQRAFIRKAASIYPNCPRFEMQVDSHYAVEDITLTPEINFSSDANTDYIMRQAYHVGHGIKTNAPYNFEGIPVPHPKTQYITFILPKATPAEDTISSFVLTSEIHEQLKIFQQQNKTVEETFTEIARDLSFNVTRIYEREMLINLIDLVYHSVLQFNFQGKLLRKGWVEGLVVGDTRCGKTETITRLVEHYRAGDISTGENTSYAGLVGGLQQTGSRWSITWGKLPLNDKRLFIIDEISGMPVEDIGKMSGVRSSGVAEITKIQTEKTFARTRLIWLGNPREARPLSSYDTGVQAIQKLIGRPEDIARFDIACTVASGEVSNDVINSYTQPKVEHKYISDVCHKLIIWAWSLKPEQVIISKEAEQLCLKLSAQMGLQYSSMIPLVEPAEQRVKIMRLAVSCAARLYSTMDGKQLLVLPSHVEYVHSLLEKMYNSSSMNYGAYSKAKLEDQYLKDPKLIEEMVRNNGVDFVEGMLRASYFRLSDLEDVLNMEKKEVKSIIAILVRNRALKHANTAYVKTPAFIQLLRKLQAEGIKPKTERNGDDF